MEEGRIGQKELEERRLQLVCVCLRARVWVHMKGRWVELFGAYSLGMMVVQPHK